MKRILKTIFKKAHYLIYPFNYKKTIWLIGSGRSGTTWISSIINYTDSYRELFEPFHTSIPEMRFFGFKQHLFLEKKDKMVFRVFSRQILKGKFYNRSVEGSTSSNQLHNNNFLIVKDIFANLLAYTICSNNNKIKPVLIIRNPFHVAFSIREREQWDWMKDPKDFLLQESLFKKYLKPFESLIIEISASGSYLEKQILIWSIINYIPLLQFNQDNLLVTFYEDWLLNPTQEQKRVYEYLDISSKHINDISDSEKVKKASKTSTKKEFNNLTLTNKLLPHEITSGIYILKKFGLDKLYNEFSIPNHNVIQQFLTNEIKVNKNGNC
jgi:hypothetical protein